MAASADARLSAWACMAEGTVTIEWDARTRWGRKEWEECYREVYEAEFDYWTEYYHDTGQCPSDTAGAGVPLSGPCVYVTHLRQLVDPKFPVLGDAQRAALMGIRELLLAEEG